MISVYIRQIDMVSRLQGSCPTTRAHVVLGSPVLAASRHFRSTASGAYEWTRSVGVSRLSCRNIGPTNQKCCPTLLPRSSIPIVSSASVSGIFNVNCRFSRATNNYLSVRARLTRLSNVDFAFEVWISTYY
jgi:hypothetical protein